MEFKQTSTQVKDIDDKKGIVVAYANIYGNKDDDGDISMPGSFTKTVKEQRKRIRVLKDHNRTQSLGVPIDLDADNENGLLTTTKFNLEKEISRDMYSDIKLYTEHNSNAELSIGFQIVKRDNQDASKVLEYKLFEYSFLTSWAANPMATVQDIKNLKSTVGIMDFLQKMYNLPYSDSRLKAIEKTLLSLEKKEPGNHSDHDEPKSFIPIYSNLKL